MQGCQQLLLPSTWHRGLIASSSSDSAEKPIPASRCVSEIVNHPKWSLLVSCHTSSAGTCASRDYTRHGQMHSPGRALSAGRWSRRGACQPFHWERLRVSFKQESQFSEVGLNSLKVGTVECVEHAIPAHTPQRYERRALVMVCEVRANLIVSVAIKRERRWDGESMGSETTARCSSGQEHCSEHNSRTMLHSRLARSVMGSDPITKHLTADVRLGEQQPARAIAALGDSDASLLDEVELLQWLFTGLQLGARWVLDLFHAGHEFFHNFDGRVCSSKHWEREMLRWFFVVTDCGVSGGAIEGALLVQGLQLLLLACACGCAVATWQGVWRLWRTCEERRQSDKEVDGSALEQRAAQARIFHAKLGERIWLEKADAAVIACVDVRPCDAAWLQQGELAHVLALRHKLDVSQTFLGGRVVDEAVHRPSKHDEEPRCRLALLDEHLPRLARED